MHKDLKTQSKLKHLWIALIFGGIDQETRRTYWFNDTVDYFFTASGFIQQFQFQIFSVFLVLTKSLNAKPLTNYFNPSRIRTQNC